jgi:uncharacterized protein (TIGR00730 family)
VKVKGGDSSERQFLSGPQAWHRDIQMAFQIFKECIMGFKAFRNIGPCVTVFGSARFKEDHRYYRLAKEVSLKLAQAGFAIITGGGPGIMEAANRGAREGKSPSLGCNIVLPHEQKINRFVDKWVEFKYLFVRKLILVKHSSAFVVMPGGWGTLDEFFEVATLIETGKIHNFPLILVGRDYWAGLETFMTETLIKSGTIDASAYKKILISDSPEEVLSWVTRANGRT